MLLLLIYLASIIDRALAILQGGLIGTFVVLFVLSALCVMSKLFDEDYHKKINLKPFIVGWVVALAVYIALPSSKTIYILAGTAYMQELAKNESVQEISNDIIEILKLKVKEARQELEKGIK